MNVFEEEGIVAYIKKRNIVKHYLKANQYMELGFYDLVDLRKRKPKSAKNTNIRFKHAKNTILILISFFLLVSCKSKVKREVVINENILSYVINPKTQNLKFYWKDKNDNNFKSFKNLQLNLQKENKELIFATNGGMFKKDFSPQGLYIENGKILNKLDTIKNGYGNFYMQPNGIFYITDKNKPVICTSKDFLQNVFTENNQIKYATQSGPLLLIDGKIHSKFNKGSKNINIRNGVSVLPNGNLLFAMSKEKINFYDFAMFFKNNACKSALYLDGFVSKTYLPSKNQIQLDGNFGVIIGIEK